MNEEIEFPEWAPMGAIGRWYFYNNEFENLFRNTHKYEKFDQNLTNSLIDQNEDDLNILKNTRDLIGNLLTNYVMKEVWEKVSEWEDPDYPYFSVPMMSLSLGAYDITDRFALEVIKCYSSFEGKLQLMSKGVFDKWQKDVVSTTEKLINLIEDTPLDYELPRKIYEKTGCTEVHGLFDEEFAFYLFELIIAAKGSDYRPSEKTVKPEIQLSQPNRPEAKREYFVLKLYEFCKKFTGNTEAKNVVVATTIAAFDLDPFSFGIDQVNRYIRKTAF